MFPSLYPFSTRSWLGYRYSLLCGGLLLHCLHYDIVEVCYFTVFTKETSRIGRNGAVLIISKGLFLNERRRAELYRKYRGDVLLRGTQVECGHGWAARPPGLQGGWVAGRQWSRATASQQASATTKARTRCFAGLHFAAALGAFQMMIPPSVSSVFWSYRDSLG